jgi:hypothetical protein
MLSMIRTFKLELHQVFLQSIMYAQISYWLLNSRAHERCNWPVNCNFMNH